MGNHHHVCQLVVTGIPTLAISEQHNGRDGIEVLAVSKH